MRHTLQEFSAKNTYPILLSRIVTPQFSGQSGASTADDLTIHVSSEAPPDWDEAVNAGTCRSLKLYHGLAWSERMRSLLGYQPLFFNVREGGRDRLRLVASILRPWFGRGLGRTLRKWAPALLHGRLGCLLWHGEPVETGDASRVHYQRLALGLEAEARRQWLWVTAGAWPTVHEDVLAAGWGRKRWGTIQLDLTQTQEDLLAAMKSSARKALRRAERDGITVCRVATLDELQDYYAFACRCAGRYGKVMHGFEDFRNMWEVIRPQAIFETFVAEHGGEVIAGLSVWGQGDSIGELGSFQSERSFAEKLYGPDLLKWAALEWGHDQGLKSFDLSGVNPEPEGKEVGIRQFKEKWGGTYYEYTIVG